MAIPTRTALGGALLIGIFVAAGGSVALEATNTQAFCVSCHSMKPVFEEHRASAHYANASGVMATCADCHVPRALGPKLVAKVIASKDLVYEVLGTIDTPAKFEASRWRMANAVWESMEANDSRECRYCHDQSLWDLTAQSEKAAEYHGPALSNEKTCIDCHKGIAHNLPEGIVPDEQLPGIDPMEEEVARR